MPIPGYDEIQDSPLGCLSDGAMVKKGDLAQPMGDRFGLTDAERTEEFDPKNDTVFYGRILPRTHT